ncbi:MAG TPA: hypothetical protein VN802_09680 [Stellaceae bacterium]|nr:hypothetical protein [Stellaceae bacterium]
MPREVARRVFVLATVLGLAAGCSTPPPRPSFPDLRFTAQPPIQLNVARIDVVTAYQAPFRPPNVEHSFPVTPAHAMENWAHDRLKAVGTSGRAVFSIRNASVIETELPRTTGIQGALTTEPSQRYDLALEANVQIVDDKGLEARSATVQSSLSKSVLEGITPNDRETAWYGMVKDAMANFDGQMEREIRNNFGPAFVQ